MAKSGEKDNDFLLINLQTAKQDGIRFFHWDAKKTPDGFFRRRESGCYHPPGW